MMRQGVVDKIKRCIQTVWPAASVHIFGSFKTGLYLSTRYSFISRIVRNLRRLALPSLLFSISPKAISKAIPVIFTFPSKSKLCAPKSLDLLIINPHLLAVVYIYWSGRCTIRRNPVLVVHSAAKLSTA